MYVCLCKGITENQIKDAVNNGASSLRAGRDQLGVMTNCGKCACFTRDVVNASINTNNSSFYAAV